MKCLKSNSITTPSLCVLYNCVGKGLAINILSHPEAVSVRARHYFCVQSRLLPAFPVYQLSSQFWPGPFILVEEVISSRPGYEWAVRLLRSK